MFLPLALSHESIALVAVSPLTPTINCYSNITSWSTKHSRPIIFEYEGGEDVLDA